MYDDAPASQSRVDKWSKRYYSTAQHRLPHDMNFVFKFDVVVDEFDITSPTSVQQMTMLSPPEPLDALIFRIAAAIADTSTEEGELDMWVEAVKTAPLMIVKFDRARTIELKRINEREGFGHQFELLYRSPFDRIFEVVDLQNKIEQELGKAAAAKQVEAVWCEHIDQSGMSEEVNKDFIELAVKIKKKLFFCGDAVR